MHSKTKPRIRHKLVTNKKVLAQLLHEKITSGSRFCMPQVLRFQSQKFLYPKVSLPKFSNLQLF